MNSVINVCYILVLLLSSFSMVSLTLILLEWGSVQTNPAFRILVLFKPLIFLRSKERSSLLSLSQATQGGLMYRWQNLQKLTIPYLVIPMVMSALAMVQASQMFPIEGKNCMPHMGHRIVTYLLGSISIVDKLNIIIPLSFETAI